VAVGHFDAQHFNLPNGNPNFATEELPALEVFFRPLKPALERFATDHNLMIERYYHDLPAWDFRFRHPKGGEAYSAAPVSLPTAVLVGRWPPSSFAL
jgi:hypothetical protein